MTKKEEELREQKRKEMKQKVMDILRENGIRMMISGLGEWGDPWITFEYKGEMIIEEGDDLSEYFSFNMFEDNEKIYE